MSEISRFGDQSLNVKNTLSLLSQTLPRTAAKSAAQSDLKAILRYLLEHGQDEVDHQLVIEEMLRRGHRADLAGELIVGRVDVAARLSAGDPIKAKYLARVLDRFADKTTNDV